MTSPFLTVIPPDATVSETEWMMPTRPHSHTYPFPLDAFQKHAVLAIERGDNVLATAKTGAGKTLLAEHLIHTRFRDSPNARIFYLNPIKSLSNQKFYDLKNQFGPHAVGIATGDIKFNPDGRILVMTTEILRNLLLKQDSSTEQLGITASLSLKHLAGVVIDEVHYINDRERGHVWEEVLMLLPPEIQLVMLSATLNEADRFAAWIGDLKQRPITLVQTIHRVVPLTHGILDGTVFRPILDADTTFHEETYRAWYSSNTQKLKARDRFQQKVRDQRRLGVEGAIEGKVRVESFPARLNGAIASLEQLKMLPAMFVVFSRRACEIYADTVQTTLVDSSDAASISHLWQFHLHTHKELETNPQALALRAFVERGIGYHHSGLLPVLKEIVEILYQRGLIRVLFATETLAVGLNMPTKTVVLLSLEKYSDGGRRFLTSSEYAQIAGRAGRRGLDTAGYCLYLPERDPVDPWQLRAVLHGGSVEFVSRMRFGYEFVLKSLHTKATSWKDLLQNSYWFRQAQEERIRVMARLEKGKAALAAFSETDLLAADKLDSLEERVRTTANATRREAQRVLGQFQNAHLGARWETLWKQRSTIQRLRNDIYDETKRITVLERYEEEHIQPLFRFLTETGYLTAADGTLTPKGVMATEVNEGHPLLMTELYVGKFCDVLKTQDEILTLLAGFLTEDDDRNAPPVPLDHLQIPPAVIDAGYAFSERVGGLMETETHFGTTTDPSYWTLSTYWAEPVWKWLNGVGMTELCSEYMVYEGNFTRALLKLANLVEEWTTLATLANDVPMLQRMHGAVERVRQSSGESLYLRLSS